MMAIAGRACLTRRSPWRQGARIVAAVLALGSAVSCASTHPSEAISLVTPTGHRVAIDSVTISYDVGGVRVIQRPSYANDVVAVDLYLIGGLQEVTPATAGIEAMALRAAEYGSEHYPDTLSRFALAATGSHIVVDAENDWTLFGLRGVTEEFDSSWAVFADRIVHPTLSDASITLVQSQLVREARERRDSPDGDVQLLADSLAFPGHPYGLDPAGDERSLSQLAPEAVRRFVASEFVTSRMLLVIVGNVSREQVERNVANTLAKLPHGSYTWHPPPRAPTHSTSLAVVNRSLSTNYLLGLFHGPPVTSPDYPAFEIATQWLSTELNQSIRIEHSLSYAAYAPFMGDALATGGIYVSTDAPDEVLPLIQEAIDSCRLQWVPAATVRQVVEFYITEYLMANQTNEAQAGSLARAQIYQGDYRLASHAMDLLRRVNPADLLRVSRRYMHDVQFAYVGNPSRIAGAHLNGI
jgi:zinc protease